MSCRQYFTLSTLTTTAKEAIKGIKSVIPVTAPVNWSRSSRTGTLQSGDSPARILRYHSTVYYMKKSDTFLLCQHFPFFSPVLFYRYRPSLNRLSGWYVSFKKSKLSRLELLTSSKKYCQLSPGALCVCSVRLSALVSVLACLSVDLSYNLRSAP